MRKENSTGRQFASGPASERGAGSGAETSQDDISTIFVVGFPDDMGEREFQNMFIFSVGFEAATLKIPSAAPPPRERPVADLAKANVANGSWDPFSGAPGVGVEAGLYEDAYGNQLLDGSNGSSNNPSALAVALANSGPREGAVSPAGARKQSIGFAKFRNRALALAARDQLSGKKVDASGATLKAEMAKKNLHTKRGLAADGSFAHPGPPLLNGALPGLDGPALARLAQAGQLNPAMLAEFARQTAAAQQQQAAAPAAPATSERDKMFNAFHSVPAHPTESTSWPPSSRQRETSGPPDDTSSPAIAHAHAAYFAQRGFSRDRASDLDHRSLSSSPPGQQPLFGTAIDHVNLAGSASSSPRIRNAVAPGAAFANVGKLMLQQLDGPAEFDDLQRSLPQLGAEQQFPSRYGFEGDLANQFGPPPRTLGSVPMGHSLSQNAITPITRSQNPADAMNTPKNTLYVGGLPAVLPSLTGPFSAGHLEDSLKQVFSRCPGFRRLCFRSKSNGPIVFVEFEDVVHATRAMQELYGHTLGGLVKSGIRLSYSKNPLGVRPGGSNNSHRDQHHAHHHQQHQQLHHQNGPGPGFGPSPLPPPQQQAHHQEGFYAPPHQRRAQAVQAHDQLISSAPQPIGFGGQGHGDGRAGGAGGFGGAGAGQAFSPWQAEY